MFILPLYDDNPTQAKTHFSLFLLIACVLVFVWQISLGAEAGAAILAYGMIPAYLFGYMPPDALPYAIPASATLITSMFLHGGLLHLLGNMLYLWIFADNVEDSIGRVKFLLFYLICGVVAALSQALVDPTSQVPMIGASGAIAGMLGAYLMLHPRANIRCIVIFFFVNIPAYIVLGGWIVLQFFSLGQAGSDVAYIAHIGGFFAGMVLIPFFKKADVKLFDTPHSSAFAVSKINRRALHIPSVKRERNHPWEF